MKLSGRKCSTRLQAFGPSREANVNTIIVTISFNVIPTVACWGMEEAEQVSNWLKISKLNHCRELVKLLRGVGGSADCKQLMVSNFCER